MPRPVIICLLALALLAGYLIAFYYLRDLALANLLRNIGLAYGVLALAGVASEHFGLLSDDMPDYPSDSDALF